MEKAGFNPLKSGHQLNESSFEFEIKEEDEFQSP